MINMIGNQNKHNAQICAIFKTVVFIIIIFRFFLFHQKLFIKYKLNRYASEVSNVNNLLCRISYA